jgi:hypothetical protein
MKFTRQVIITVNGPGEISGWLYPLATGIKREFPGTKICVAMLPCVFSSGSELRVLLGLPYVDAACSVKDTLAMVCLNRFPPEFDRRLPGFVFHLGGEACLAWLIAKRLGQPSFAYVETPFTMQSHFTKVFYTGFEKIGHGKAARGSDIAGELMIDATLMRCPDREANLPKKFIIGIYPGSRSYMVRYILPFVAVAAELVAAELPDTEFIMAKADFLPIEFLKNLPEADDGRPIEGQNLDFVDDDGSHYLVCRSGLRIKITSNREAMSAMRMAVTIPGTNTAELGVLGIPFVMILPTFRAETSPLPGLAGHLGAIPFFGRSIKRGFALWFLKRFPFFSHPNRRAGRLIVPEIVSELTARELADALLAMARADNRVISQELQKAMGAAGATMNILKGLRDRLPTAFSMPESAKTLTEPAT